MSSSPKPSLLLDTITPNLSLIECIAIPKSSAFELIGLFKCFGAPRLSLMNSATKISNPPYPGLPLDEK